MRQFVREIPLALVKKAEIDNLDQFGFTLVYTADSIVVYAEVKETRLDYLQEAA